MIGGASTVMWMLGFNKPIIYLHTNKFRHLNLEAQQIVKNAFITIDIDEDNWEIKLKKFLINLIKNYKNYGHPSKVLGISMTWNGLLG